MKQYTVYNFLRKLELTVGTTVIMEKLHSKSSSVFREWWNCHDKRKNNKTSPVEALRTNLKATFVLENTAVLLPWFTLRQLHVLVMELGCLKSPGTAYISHSCHVDPVWPLFGRILDRTVTYPSCCLKLFAKIHRFVLSERCIRAILLLNINVWVFTISWCKFNI